MKELIYIGLGLIGAIVHWWKKHYVDHTTKASLVEYVISNFNYTLYAVGAIAFAEISLSFMQVGEFTLQNVIGALTAGYTFDSGINKAPKDV
jgi:hypothetical protein